ncbi:MAG: sulfatase-like hydrolase/transferase [Acidimicrobiia bacterium]|nr:sulfatase-like hydrolase/transferase [Acidimicrobiia bacterium]
MSDTVLTDKASSKSRSALLRKEPMVTWWWTIAAIAVVGSLTLSQPLLSLLGRSPEFFVAKEMTSLEIVLFALGVTLVPVVLAVPLLIVRGVSPMLGQWALDLVLGAMVAVFVAYFLDEPGRPWEQIGGIALGVGVLFAMAYHFSKGMRTAVRFLVPAPLLIVALFLLTGPVSALVWSGDEIGAAVGSDAADTPVVVLVTDEFPLSTIMSGEGEFVEEGFPNLARLADDGVWYRNAVANAAGTAQGIPAIATGKITKLGDLPTSTNHPDSMFTALRRSHAMRVTEQVTKVCPEDVCSSEETSRIEMWKTLISDVRIIATHLVLPTEQSQDLPAIDANWGNFAQEGFETGDILEAFNAAIEDDRRAEFDEFFPVLREDTERPLFAFGHFLLPHQPWLLLDDGTFIGGAGFSIFDDGVVWDRDWPRALGMQRHLLVAKYVDTRIGQILDELEANDLYDDALVMLVSDHGAGWVPGQERREPIQETAANISSVPFIVKYPDGFGDAPAAGSVDSARAETIDVAPTVFDVLGVEPPYAVDGVSLLDVDGRSERTETTITGPRGTMLTAAAAFEGLFEDATEVDRWFPNRDPWELRHPDAPPDLLGSTPEVRDDPAVEVSVVDRERFEAVDPDTEPYPAVVYADVSGAEEGTVAGILVDGQVVTLTETFQPYDLMRAAAVIPKGVLKTGSTDVDMVLFDEAGNAYR